MEKPPFDFRYFVMCVSQVFKRFVEIGRVAYISFGPHAGKLVAIVDVIDQNRVSEIGLSSVSITLDLFYIVFFKLCFYFLGPCWWSLHRCEETIHALQVHAAYRLRHQSTSQVSGNSPFLKTKTQLILNKGYILCSFSYQARYTIV